MSLEKKVVDVKNLKPEEKVLYAYKVKAFREMPTYKHHVELYKPRRKAKRLAEQLAQDSGLLFVENFFLFLRTYLNQLLKHLLRL